MSAVAGLYRPDGRAVHEGELGAMVDTMSHRGPDGVGVWVRGGVGLAHRMLLTTPESLSEEQPLADAETGITITADARIDNREALIAELRPRLPESLADSALILEAYKRWGEDCVGHLIGDFAFAVWDERKQRLFCAKDHLGIKDFYYTHSPGRLFAFGSEIKALFALDEVSEEVDEGELGRYLTRVLVDAGRTVFRGVDRLLPGHTLTVDASGLKLRQYWEPGPSDEPVPSTDAGCADRFRELFTEAVRCRLRSAFPVGTELSGGLDSTFVTCLARDLLSVDDRSPMPTVSLVSDLFPECDERAFIEEVVRQGGLRPHYVVAEEHGLIDLLDDIFTYLDDGRAGGNHHYNWLSAVAAREAGMRVILTGLDGDTTVGHGWEYLSELALEERWEAFAYQAKAAAARLAEEIRQYDVQEQIPDAAGFVSGYAMPVLKRWAQRGAYVKLWRAVSALDRLFGISPKKVYTWLWRDALLPTRQAEARRMRARVTKAHRSVPPIIDPGLARRLGLADRLAAHALSIPELQTVREKQRDTLSSPYLSFSVEKVSLYSAANGVEARHPFMDKRLVEYCLSLPPEQSLNDGWSRVVMRRAMEGIVPPTIQWRMGKTDLGAPYRHVLLDRDPDRVEGLLEKLEVARGLLNVEYVKDAYHKSGEASDEALRGLGLALTLTYWLEKRSRGTVSG